jgi:predicted RNA-binding Zn-ribbon protein involved in translation (DUF1610 family)
MSMGTATVEITCPNCGLTVVKRKAVRKVLQKELGEA